MPLVLGHTHEAIQPATYSQMIQEKNYRKIEKNGGGVLCEQHVKVPRPGIKPAP